MSGLWTAIVGVAAAVGSMLAACFVCVVIGLLTGLICRCVALGWHAAWTVFT